MAYTNLETLKTYLGVTTSNDDAILTSCLDRAIAIFEQQLDYKFEAQTETRYFDPNDVVGPLLWLDAPLLTVTTLTNGDSAATVIPSDDYWMLPRNQDRYWRIKLKTNGTTTGWEFATDCEVSLLGTWGYMATASNTVIQAVLRLASYIYRQRDSQVFDVTASPELGIMTIPSGIPKDVAKLIDIIRSSCDLA